MMELNESGVSKEMILEVSTPGAISMRMELNESGVSKEMTLEVSTPGAISMRMELNESGVSKEMILEVYTPDWPVMPLVITSCLCEASTMRVRWSSGVNPVPPLLLFHHFFV